MFVVIVEKFATAHTKAYKRVQILHRDVSAGNILITEERSGILIDWDLSKKRRQFTHGKTSRSRAVQLM
ncbi:hypothetical protein EDB92DRAFT_1879660 [Lactarius akahatsu]|uniref:Protein kinase domain-containing protein n=1 Tax=Lactarius akahatsu TaxID=416441 RepID=A0AAD4LE86_9AGAM|nr:hypothetical protein EDB92DRAFT_1879660 [Lactarius akahatsu]